MGQVRKGMYVDDCEGVHPNVIECYYGTHGPERHHRSGETDVGQLDDEEISTPPSASGSDSDEVDMSEKSHSACNGMVQHVTLDRSASEVWWRDLEPVSSRLKALYLTAVEPV
ncbi:hypothetical protein DFH08DRAFT_810468 [Mycena albidolilacea]|uniref:Uncharacterized protein n=1 Tax=Mycena albidolilacea TaxID=1033008 RepID=A0AAD6ZZG6_9AGAR|nr:hypothetical protein DFH08DRAFT_810468 [Mycena albidolilacea]